MTDGNILETLVAELEGLHTLDQLIELARDRLGLDPQQFKPARGRAAFTAALVEHAAARGLVEALIDVLAAERRALGRELLEVRKAGYGPPVPVRGNFGPFAIEAKLGEGPDCDVYRARRDGTRFRLRIVVEPAGSHPSAVERYLAQCRGLRGLKDKGLPSPEVAERMDGRAAVAFPSFEGLPLLSHMGAPIKLRKAWPLLREILEPLAALHARRITHGALHPNNIFVASPEEPHVALVDVGTYYLRRHNLASGGNRPTGLALPLRYAAPEQLLGDLPTPRSDVYSFGLLLYALLTGKPAFPGTPRDVLRQRFSTSLEPLSFAAPRGWVGPDLDELMLQMLDDAPERRPADAESVLEVLETIAGQSAARDSTFPDADFDAQVERLLADPTDEMASAILEASIDQGADARRVADAFRLAAEQLETDAAPHPARRRLLTRAGGLFETVVGDAKAAARTYELLLSTDRHDPAAWGALENAYKRIGNYDALAELLLQHAEGSTEPHDKAQLFSKLGALLATKMDDLEQARVAFTQAVIEDPTESEYSEELERLTGSDRAAWGDILDTCSSAAMEIDNSDRKNALLLTLGRWYEERAGRLDLGLQCYQAVLLSDPGSDAALQRSANIYRRAQQWHELAEILELRADGAVIPAVARSLRIEAAEIRATHLGDVTGAIRLCEQVLGDDPGNPDASRTLAQLFLKTGDLDDYVKVMKQRASSLSGEHRLEVLSDLAKVHADDLGNIDEAIRLYEQILAQDPSDVEALRSLDAAYTRTGQLDKVRSILERQLDLAVTPRQKVELLERIAGLYATEFLDNESAASALERILDVEPAHESALTGLARIYRDSERWGDLAWTLERRAERTSNDAVRKELLKELGGIVHLKLEEPDRAIDVYERVLAIDPNDSRALDAMVSLRSLVGDDARAAEALDALAAAESNATKQAEHLVKAGELVERRGDTRGAIQRYDRALKVEPGNARAATALGKLYERIGEVPRAVDVLRGAAAETGSAPLFVELGALLRRAGDAPRARGAIGRALELEPNNLEALLQLAELEFEAEHYEQAVARYAAVRRDMESSAPERLHPVLHRHARALLAIGRVEDARGILHKLAQEMSNDPVQVWDVAELAFLLEPPDTALPRVTRLLDLYGAHLTTAELSEALYWEGELSRRLDRFDAARSSLERSAQTDPSATLPLEALVKLHRQLEAWLDASKAIVRLLERVTGDERTDLLVQAGDLAANELGDAQAAAERYLTALSARPKDRRILLKLVELHSKERDWEDLIGDIMKLVELTDEPAQKARYLHTAARVCGYELEDGERALELIDRAIELDPASESILADAVALKSSQGDVSGVRALLEQQIKRAAESHDKQRVLRLASELAELHLSEFNVDEAVAVNEAALRLAGHDTKLEEVLLDLYSTDPVRYLDRAVNLERSAIRRDPLRPEPYRAMRKVYAEAKRRDATWACCQVLSVLASSAPDEELFYKKHRRHEPIPLGTRITSADFAELVAHPQADPAVTRIFGQIQPIIAAERGRPLEELGVWEDDEADPRKCPGTLVRSIELAVDALRLSMPLFFVSAKAAAPITLARARRRALVLSADAARAELPALRATFVAGAHIAYFRQGFYVRTLLPTVAAQKAWLLAAIKLIAPRLPIAAELEGPTTRAYEILKERLTGNARELLADPVDDLMRRGGRADVARWTAGVDLTSDRVGLILCDDLATARLTIEATGDNAAAVSAASRTQALLEYSVSGQYLKLRDHLRLSLDWREVEEIDLDAAEPVSVRPRP